MEIPEDHVDTMADRREELMGQLRYLIDEAGALGPALAQLPEDVLETAPPDQFSVKQALGLLADGDRKVFRPRLHRIIAEDRPTLEPLDEERIVEQGEWNQADIPDILEAVREERKELITFLENLPAGEWDREGLLPDRESQNIYELAYFIGQHDVHHLRQLGLMMHGTNLTDGEDLPK